MTRHIMDCAEFDDRLADYLEGTLDAADRRAIDVHLASCMRCSALVRDLEDIRASAARLPELAPSSDLWSGIARRIEAPVVPLAARTAPNVARRPMMDRLRTAAIAAALVAVTAGVTYTLTISRTGGRADTAVAANQPPVANRDTIAPTFGGDSARRAVPAARETMASATPASGSDTETAERGKTPVQRVRDVPEAVTYSREIDRLRTIFARNRALLDPRTAAIIEANLKVIDDAIAQSKAALAQDPASRFLTDQLNSALDKKLELLRTAALLPNRT
jgi:anti-sigma factor RsiW